jgi:uroporphyrinogen decarboxylase
MNSRDRVLRALERKEPDRVPIIEWDVDQRVRRQIAGNEDLLDTVEKLDLDGVAVRPDYRQQYFAKDSYIDEWGCKKRVTNQYLDTIIENPIVDIHDCPRYAFPDPYAAHRFDSLQRAVSRLGRQRAVIFSCRDVFSDLRDLLGYEAALMYLATEPVLLGRFLSRCIEYNLTLARLAHEKFGLDIILTTDDIADNRGLIFGPRLYHEFFAPRFAEVIKGFKDIGYYCIKHCDGLITDILEHFLSCGIDCIDPIDPLAGMDIKSVKDRYGARVCIKGNIDCTGVLVHGSWREVEEAVRYCIRNVAQGGGYILSSSNTIHSGVNPDNFLHMIKVARQVGIYPIGSQPL